MATWHFRGLIAWWLLAGNAISATELTRLDAANWERFAPQGKEVDCILGDFVLRNRHFTCVIAQPIAGRNANMTVKNVGGCVIDMTVLGRESDQLSAYYPGGGDFEFRRGDLSRVTDSGEKKIDAARLLSGIQTDDALRLRFHAEAVKGKPAVTVQYDLSSNDRSLLVTTTYTNPHDAPIEILLRDRVRADRTFVSGVDKSLRLAWWYDEWFGQAYGLVPDRGAVEIFTHPAPKTGKTPPPEVRYLHADGKATVTLAPKQSYIFSARLMPGANLFDVKALACDLATRPTTAVNVLVRDGQGAVHDGRVTLLQGETRVAWGRTDEQGRLSFRIPTGRYLVKVEDVTRGERTAPLFIGGPDGASLTFDLPSPGFVRAAITDEHGRPIACKVEFRFPGAKLEDDFTINPNKPAPKDGPPPKPKPPGPDFGPDSGEHAVRNLYYTHTGSFRQELPPGKYNVVISHGNEYDAVFTSIEVDRGRETPLTAKLMRAVDTRGWISSDFHSHATPSGDNTASQLGRVLNLLAEHIEFAPCTEHNRVDSYVPHLKRLRAEAAMATCSGIELTGQLLPVNHQNAFPLLHKPRTQDGGGPTIDENPVLQIERLALWDSRSEKLMQMNHPGLVQILGDRDTDGKPDEGFEKMFGFVDVMEVHPPHLIFAPPRAKLADAHKDPATIFHWMQMLNLGYRIPGTVCTDAHYNFHGSGFLRTYVRSVTDDPAEVKTLDVVRTSQRGQMIMTNGPFLEVTLTAVDDKSAARGATDIRPDPRSPTPDSSAGPGDDLAAPGKAELHVRVQCANWLDVNRVQVFVNGRPDPKLNFTRREHGEKFRRGIVRFDERIPLALERDAHVIVATIGEGAKLGLVLGPTYGQDQPVAVSNPIFVDVNGNGFQANGDLLGLEIPRQAKPTAKRPR